MWNVEYVGQGLAPAVFVLCVASVRHGGTKAPPYGCGMGVHGGTKAPSCGVNLARFVCKGYKKSVDFL